ncbi:hypothetical protein EV693_10655 [Nicoletella semolina]|uniref:Transcriptional regulator n=1 Tax=Nicoletella semolina TaxID=271160 RepID=A0A4R2N8S7_9PAST|nr:YtfJ family protein [Nicoletella semolina]MDH2924499.1 hypothetical protein [Nicoletella semolina]TCP17373.1 hypothetical protein EV693_10655 [Nicoletella semolina]
MKKLLTITLGAFFVNIAAAHNIQLNTSLPTVSVIEDGELVASDNNITYRPWQSTSLIGKVRVVHHLAGRSSVKAKNEALFEAIKASNFDRTRYQTTTIINADDAIIATGAFVKNSAEDGKLANAHSQVILDQNSTVKKAWQLKEKESFIAVLDKNGKVQFVSEGKLSSEQIQTVINNVKALLK